jgi:transposase
MNATHQSHCTQTPTILYMALELGEAKWKLGFTTGIAQKPRLREIAARDLKALEEEIRQAKERFQLTSQAPVLSCYEAGRDGFWLHRALVAVGVDNRVVDSSSIEVNRRKRRVKTDRLDAEQLLKLLIRCHQGERKVWSEVRVPSEEEEDARQLHRELKQLKEEQTAHTNRIKGLLASYGVTVPVNRHFPRQLEAVRTWNGRPLPEDLHQRLLREFARMQQLNGHIRHLENERGRHLRDDQQDAGIGQMRKLLQLRGIGPNMAWLAVREVFGWRQIKNRRELASLAGLTPTPYSSGQESRDQGISKAGNRRLRAMLIEIAWRWLIFQPQSTLSKWFWQRFGHGSKRLRRIGIVAVARKLLVALWKYLQTGLPPEGAELVDWKDKLRYHTLSLTDRAA